ncbi:MAG: DHA1 family inner membrane transport protein [Halieaceae bacterium]|jgi:DHA1 family inner membrane transport protein
MSSKLLIADIRQRETLRPLAAGALLYTIGPAAIMLMPMIVGVYVDAMGFSGRESGFLASAEAAGMAIASVLAIFWVRRLNWQRVALFGIALSVVANLLATGIDGFLPMVCCRIAASTGAGTAFAVSVASLAERREPERAYGVGLVVETAMVILMIALSPLVIERWASDGIFYMLALLGIIVALPILWLPKRSEKLQQIEREKMSKAVPNFGPIMVVLLATLIHFIGTVGFWTYLERIADAAGHSTAYIGTVLALGLGAGLPGAAVAALLGDRLGFAWPFITSTLVLVGAVVLAVGNINALVLAICAISFSFMWILASTYQFALMARLDAGGSLVVLMPAASGVGGMAGPALAAVLITESNYLPVNVMAGACFIISLCLFLIVLPRLKAC